MTEVHSSFFYADSRKGRATTCVRSPLPSPPLTVTGDGWTLCPRSDRGTPGFEYGLVAGSTFNGFRGSAAKTYYRRVRRPLA